jgi:spectinomycin phosphotransferase
MRQPPSIAEEQLRACLQDQYGLLPISIEFLPVGLDYNAGVYRVMSGQGTAYLLKVTSRPLYEPACRVPRYLNDQGITSVMDPVSTRGGALWARVDEWTVIVYPYINGDTSWTGMTNEQWQEVGTIFRQIHQVALPPQGFESLRKETFDPSEYTRWVRDFETHHLHSQTNGNGSRQALRADWLVHQSTIHTVMDSLEKLAEALASRALPYVIAHADLHPANLLRGSTGRVFVIDWDEVMLAPKERDFIFVREPYAEAFFEGYGQREIEWMALTYYLWERVIQDLIACAQEVFFRDDLGEGTKEDSFKLFHAILTEGGEVDAASQASTHLPSNLTIPRRMISGIEKELAERE